MGEKLEVPALKYNFLRQAVPLQYCTGEESGLAVFCSVREYVIGLGVGLTQALLLLCVLGHMFRVDGPKGVVMELKECGEGGLSLPGLE